jgi:hypothetical protein
MDNERLEMLVGWAALLALFLASVAVLAYWLRHRVAPAGALFLSMAGFASAVLIRKVFPDYALVPHPVTGEQVFMLQNQTLHQYLLGVMGLAALMFPISFWWLLRSVVPRPRGLTDQRA